MHNLYSMKARFISTRAQVLLAILLSSTVVTAQTRVVPPNNSYSPAQDVELGRQAAAQVRQELPLLRDDLVTSYVEGIGRRYQDDPPVTGT